ncbi:DNA binding transcription factor, partial [Yamadazyma tenuis ATCC 10573]
MRRKSKRSLTVKQRKKQVVKARDKNSKKEQVSLNSPEDLKNDCSEVTNTNPNKRKVAPRSSDQFKVGPDFDDTEVHRKCFISSTKEHIVPVISARIDRGFDLINNEWVGYKRNYFTLVSTFEFLDQPGDLCSNTKFHICDDEGKEVNIECFAIRLVSECCENDVGVVLVQHTPKRDRGPQYLPPVFVSVPGVLPEHEVIKSSANIRNGVKMSQLDRLFYLEENKLKQAKEGSILKGYPKGKVCTVAKYERMQFSTTLNYRKPALLNRRFVLRVELLAVLADEKYSVLASSETPPLIVRGRSPSNY